MFIIQGSKGSIDWTLIQIFIMIREMIRILHLFKIDLEVGYEWKKRDDKLKNLGVSSHESKCI